MTKTRRKQIMLALIMSAFFVIISFGIQKTYAALQMKSETVENSFSPMESKTPKINEDVLVNENNHIIEKNEILKCLV